MIKPMSNLISNGCRNPHWDESQILLVKGTTWMVISPLVMANLPVWMVKCNVLMVKCKLLMVKSNPYFLKIICFFHLWWLKHSYWWSKSTDLKIRSWILRGFLPRIPLVETVRWFKSAEELWDALAKIQRCQVRQMCTTCFFFLFSKETWSLAMEKMVGVRLSSQTCVFIPGNMSSCSQNRDCGNQANHFNPQSLWWLHAICVWIIPIYL